MIRIKDLQRQYRELVGFDDSDGLANSLRSSNCVLSVCSQHPYINMRMLEKIAPSDLANTGGDWKSTKNYYKDDLVVYLSKQYRATDSSKGLAPSDNPSKWELFTPFDKWLSDMRDKSISKMLMRFQSDKITAKASKVLLESKCLFETTGRMTDTIENSGSMVGFQIIPPRYQSVSVQIRRIGLQMKGTGAVKMYLYHSSQVEPLRDITLTRTKSGSMQWFDVDDLFIGYRTAETDAGGSYYLVYDQTELPSGCEAINKVYDWSKQPCPSCSKIDYENYMQWSKMVGIVPFKVAADTNGDMWDVDDMVETGDKNYGINLQISVSCDLSNFLSDNKMEFADLLMKQMALDILLAIYYNPNSRINLDTSNGNFNVLYVDINGDQMKSKTGMRYELEQAYKAVDINTRGLDKICLPCANKGLRVHSI